MLTILCTRTMYYVDYVQEQSVYRKEKYKYSIPYTSNISCRPLFCLHQVFYLTESMSAYITITVLYVEY